MKKLRFLAFLLALLLASACALAEPADDPVFMTAGTQTILLSEAQAMLDSTYAQQLEYAESYGYSMTEADLQTIKEYVINSLSQRVVMKNKVAEYGLGEITEEDRASLREEADRVFSESLEAYIDTLVSYYGITEEEARTEATTMLDTYGLSAESQYELMLDALLYNRLFDYVTQDITVTDEQVQAEYDTNYVAADQEEFASDLSRYEFYATYPDMYDMYYGGDIYYIPEGFRTVKHILLSAPEAIATEMTETDALLTAERDTLDALNEEMYALENVVEEPAEEGDAESTPRTAEEIQADIDATNARIETLEAQYEELKESILPALQETIDTIYSRLEGGEDFDALVAEYGEDPGMESSPNGYMVHERSTNWIEPFRAASMALANEGDVSDPVLTDFGVHIIQYVGDVEGGPVPMSETTRQTIYDSLLYAAQNERFSLELEAWMEAFPVETNDALLVMPQLVAAEEVPAEEAPAEDDASAGDAEAVG